MNRSAMCMFVACFIGAAWSFARAQDEAGGRPEALKLASAARSAELLRTVRLEYVRHDRNPRHQFGAHSYFHSWSAAGDERIATAWGDEEGVCVRDERGEPGIEYSEIGPQSTLMAHGEIWQHRDDSTRAVVQNSPRALSFLPVAEQFFDLRQLGIDPFGADRDIDQNIREYGEGPLRYSSKSEGKMIVVSAETASGSRFLWWIDPGKDYSVIQSATEHEGKRLIETHYEVAQFDGVWFPKRIDRYRVAAGERVGADASETIEFLTVEFNRAEHRRHFGPEDIGIDAGVNVVNYDSLKGGMWDGKTVVSSDEFVRRFAAGELARGPNVTRVLRQRGLLPEAAGSADKDLPTVLDGSPMAPAVGFAGAVARMRNSRESEWERYVRSFIERYQLDASQTERAKAVLKDCQERAAKLTGDRKEALDQLATRMKKPEAREKARDDMSRELCELRDSLQRVFDEQLKPRLEKLPTRAQRDAAGEPAAASQPAAK